MKDRKIVLDTETTGLYPKNGDRIIEVGCVEIINNIRTGNFFHTYINPQRDVPAEAFRVHGISAEFLQDKPIFRKIADDLLDFIGSSTVVIHNANFDLSFLNHEFGLQGYQPINPGRAIDTLTLARKKFPGSPASLDALCRRFNVSLDSRDKHGALIDAELLAQVYILMCGNAQAILDLTQQNAKQIEAPVIEDLKKHNKKIRDFSSLFEESNHHKEFISTKLKQTLWYNDDIAAN